MDVWFCGELCSIGLATDVAESAVATETEDKDFIKTDGDELEGEVAAVETSDENSNEESDEDDGVGECRAKGGRIWEGREVVEWQTARGKSLSGFPSSSSSLVEVRAGNEAVEKPGAIVKGLLLG